VLPASIGGNGGNGGRGGNGHAPGAGHAHGAVDHDAAAAGGHAGNG
jgi:hypothetical protein